MLQFLLSLLIFFILNEHWRFRLEFAASGMVWYCHSQGGQSKDDV